MYREYQPPPQLRAEVRCLWRGIGGPKRIVPDGCLDLIVAGREVFVAGPDTRAWRSGVPAGTALHGVRFRPGRAPSVLGVAAHELRDQRVSLTDLWGPRGREVTERLLAAPATLPEVVAEARTGDTDPAMELVLARLDAGVSRVERALRGLDIGARQFRRRFSEAVGYGPATYLRVARLQRAFAHASDAPGLASLAAAAGYADQAHLSRDCRELTGATPTELFGDDRSVQADAA